MPGAITPHTNSIPGSTQGLTSSADVEAVPAEKCREAGQIAGEDGKVTADEYNGLDEQMKKLFEQDGEGWKLKKQAADWIANDKTKTEPTDITG